MPGLGMDTRWNGFLQFRFIDDRVRAGDRLIDRRQFGDAARFSPAHPVTQIAVDGVTGEEIDFANARPGHGTTINFRLRLNPTEHLELTAVQNERELNVNTPLLGDGRLLTSRLTRVNSTYNFTARLFVRGIAQSTSTRRRPALFLS